jgi:hypothetical protein
MISKMEIIPSYAIGFCFTWQVSQLTAPAQPWTFYVEESPTGVPGDKSWVEISPALVDTLVYQEQGRTKFDKDYNLFFRVRMEAGGAVTYSPVVDGYGTLSRKDFLLAQEMMRQKHLAYEQLSGVCLCLWKKMHDGVPCTACIDPITGEVLDPECRECHGTRWIFGFFGPYVTCGIVSAYQSDKKFAQSGAGVDEELVYNIEMVGFPRLIRDDLLRECKSDVMFRVHRVSTPTELRRVPIVQIAQVTEVDRDDVVHFLGHEEVTP